MNKTTRKLYSTNDPRIQILKDLEKTGYPVELKVARILLQNEWSVDHNRYYIDEDEQKGREIDISADTILVSRKLRGGVGLHLMCEVKQSPKNPWVVLSSGRSSRSVEAEGYNRLQYTIGSITSAILSYGEIKRMSTTNRFARIGRTYYEAFKSPKEKSAIFQALAQVVKASEYWLKKRLEDLELEQDQAPIRSEDEDTIGITFIDPIIILDGLLYEAYLGDDNHLEVNEIKHIPVSFGYISSAYSRPDYLVEIVTVDEFSKLLVNKRKWILDIQKILMNGKSNRNMHQK